MKTDIRRIALEFASHGVDGMVESDGMWEEIEKVLGREATVAESREVGNLLNGEARKLRRRAIRLLNRTPRRPASSTKREG